MSDDALVLRDSASRKLLQLSTQLCSRDDCRRILDHIGVRLAERSAAAPLPEKRDER